MPPSSGSSGQKMRGSWIRSTKLYGIIAQKRGILTLLSFHVLLYKPNRRGITSRGTEVVGLYWEGFVGYCTNAVSSQTIQH